MVVLTYIGLWRLSVLSGFAIAGERRDPFLGICCAVISQEHNRNHLSKLIPDCSYLSYLTDYKTARDSKQAQMTILTTLNNNNNIYSDIVNDNFLLVVDAAQKKIFQLSLSANRKASYQVLPMRKFLGFCNQNKTLRSLT